MRSRVGITEGHSFFFFFTSELYETFHYLVIISAVLGVLHHGVASALEHLLGWRCNRAPLEYSKLPHIASAVNLRFSCYARRAAACFVLQLQNCAYFIHIALKHARCTVWTVSMRVLFCVSRSHVIVDQCINRYTRRGNSQSMENRVFRRDMSCT